MYIYSQVHTHTHTRTHIHTFFLIWRYNKLSSTCFFSLLIIFLIYIHVILFNIYSLCHSSFRILISCRNLIIISMYFIVISVIIISTHFSYISHYIIFSLISLFSCDNIPCTFASLHFPFPLLPFPTLHFPSLPYLSLPYLSLHLPSLPFPSLHFTSLPFPSLYFPSLPFTSLVLRYISGTHTAPE